MHPWACAHSAKLEGHLQKEKGVKGRGSQNHRAYYRHRVLAWRAPGLRDFVESETFPKPSFPGGIRAGSVCRQRRRPSLRLPVDFKILREGAGTSAFAARGSSPVSEFPCSSSCHRPCARPACALSLPPSKRGSQFASRH